MEEFRGQAFITVPELASILRISKSQAYELLKAEDCGFNILQLGKRKIIPMNDFKRWYDSFASKRESED